MKTLSANGQCVEFARVSGAMAVRDSKDPAGSARWSSPGEFTAFVCGVTRGEFDQP
ncbi:DUF397 domain-containing protein [Streptomyces tremellae]|uniref:DUF397 domain-containing protein n=1 Tax=Streptomyces tremellae TaxID=1124239 RepID=UPI0031F0465D